MKSYKLAKSTIKILIGLCLLMTIFPSTVKAALFFFPPPPEPIDSDGDGVIDSNDPYPYNRDIPNPRTKQWTVMWYCSAEEYVDLQLERISFTKTALNEIYQQIMNFCELSDLSTFWNNVYITMMVDNYRQSTEYSFIDQHSKFIKIINGDIIIENKEPTIIANFMSSADTLESFIDDSQEDCPANNYVFCFTGHGHGQFSKEQFPNSPGGIMPTGVDKVEDFYGLHEREQNLLTAGELATAFSGKNIDILVAGNCFAGAIEFVGGLAGKVDYYVGTEFMLSGTSSNDGYAHPLVFYDSQSNIVGVLELLKNSLFQTPKTLANSICDEIVNYIELKTSKVQILVTCDLTKWSDLTSKFSAMCSEMRTGGLMFDEITRTFINSLQNMPDDRGKHVMLECSDDQIYDVIDFLEMCATHPYSSYIRIQAQNIIDILNQVICHTSKTNWQTSYDYCHGLSIYCPKSSGYWFPVAYSSTHVPWATSAGWFQLMEHIY